ncbi:MAG TPA: site-2 protease family protein [Candidatus Saccharimonadales bacterium]|nr:site-2 protease family protein [Candidatus Saccharimonadales bacterium]
MGIFLLIVGLLLFISLVVLHELGHFWAARRGGVDIEEFGIFFPPRLYKHKTKAGYDFTINLLPLGGFVKLKGEHDSDTGKGSYGAAPTHVKLKIMLAGVFMNLVTALVLFILLALIGMPHIIDNQYVVASDAHYQHRATYKALVDRVEKGSPAAKAGIERDDAIVAIGTPGHLQTLSSTNDISDLTTRYSGRTVAVRMERHGKMAVQTIHLRSDADIAVAAKHGKTVGHLGVETSPAQDGLTVVRSTWSAPIVAGGTAVQLTTLTFQGLGKAVAGLGGIFAGAFTHNTTARQSAQTEASSQVSGPVGIFFVFKYGAVLGYKFILMVVAVISLTLAIMNVLPIPALDGGRLFVTIISRLTKKQISQRTEEAIYGTGFAVLMLLIVVITVVDVKRFF